MDPDAQGRHRRAGRPASGLTSHANRRGRLARGGVTPTMAPACDDVRASRQHALSRSSKGGRLTVEARASITHPPRCRSAGCRRESDSDSDRSPVDLHRGDRSTVMRRSSAERLSATVSVGRGVTIVGLANQPVDHTAAYFALAGALGAAVLVILDNQLGAWRQRRAEADRLQQQLRAERERLDSSWLPNADGSTSSWLTTADCGTSMSYDGRSPQRSSRPLSSSRP